MVKVFPLDIVLTQVSEYATGKREALIIREIGTDSSTETTPEWLVIDDHPLGEITETMSPLSKINSLFVDLLDLGSLYYVVPPETSIIVDGAATQRIRCKGHLLKMAVGESMPTNFMARFKEQHNHYMTFEYDTVDWAAGKSFEPEEEVEVISYTPTTIEEVIIRGLVQAKCPDWSRTFHEISLRFYLENAPLDFILTTTKVGGLDLYNTPYPPSELVEHRGYILPDPGIKVPADHTLSIRMRCIKAVAIAIGAGAGNGPHVAVALEYRKTA